MTTKAVTLAIKGENGADVALPHTSADLTGYVNENAPGVENVAGALDDLFAKSPGNISALTGRVDALESGQTEQDADISAAAAAAADWTASKPGIVQRVETLEEKVQPFTAPTASTPGKAGLVPTPGATDPSQQALRVLTMNGFGTLTAGSLDVSWERADSTNIVLGAELVPAGSSVNAFTVAGDYYADTWTDAPLNEQGILSIREMRTHGNATDDTRIQYATFLALTSNKLFWRGGGSKRPAGQPWTWAIDWREVLGGGTDKAPMPHAPDGMAGSWQLVIAQATDPYLRIPAGGSWAVYSGAIWVDGAMDTDGYASVFAGGTVIGPLILYSSARQSALCYMVQNSSTKHSITNDEWQARDIVRRVDGSYVIRVHELPYHVPNEDAYANLWIEVDTYAQAHPEQVTDEPAPPVPTEEELLARAKTLKTSEFDRAMADIDAKLARSTSDIVAAMLTPATLAAETDAALLSADELEKSKTIFVTLRSIQKRNRILRKQVTAAENIEEVQGIEPTRYDLTDG